MTVPPDRVEAARAAMIELFPQGFEELEHSDGVELAAYTDAGGEERIRAAFSGVVAAGVPGDWADRWRRFHRPLRIGDLWVGPPWEDPPAGVTTVVIDPGRAFGTGGHATTRLCLELLAEQEPHGSVLDVGCGSGVLAITAAKIGFAPVRAVDRDPQAVEVTRENAAANHVTVEVERADAFSEPLPEVNLAVANITLEGVEIVTRLVAADRLVTSGYLSSDAPAPGRYRHLARREREGWAADLWERSE